MIGNPLSFETASALKPNFPFIDELLQKGSMVDYFIVASQFRILVFEGIEAMRAGRHNFLDIVTIQHLYIRHCLHLEKKFISGSPGRISRAGFFRTQHRKPDPYFIKNFHKSLSYLFITIVV